MGRRPGTTAGTFTCNTDGHVLGTDRLLLRTLRPDDLDEVIATVDRVVLRWQGFPSEPDALREFFRLKIDPGLQVHPKYNEHFLISERSSGKIMGLRSLYSNPRRNGTLATGSWLGEGWRGRGFGSEELRVIVAYAVEHQHATRMIAGTENTNERALRQYRSAGFRLASRTKEHALPDGRTVPAVWLARSFRRSRKAAICALGQPSLP